MKSKAYSSASNAKRAAKTAGFTLEQVNITNDADGYYFEEIKAKPAKKEAKAPKADKPAKEKKPTAKQVEAALVDQGDKAPKTEIKSPVLDDSNPDNLVLADGRTEEEIISKGDIGYSCRNGGDPILIIRKSATKNPVQVVWDIFDELKQIADEKGEKLSRKDSIAYAVRCGIAFYTARTQFQSWKTANKF